LINYLKEKKLKRGKYMINITKVLTEVSGKVDKNQKYLKGLFNKEKQGLIEQFGESLDDDILDRLSLMRVGKRYNLTKDTIDIFIVNSMSDEDVIIPEDGEDIITTDDDEDAIITDDEEDIDTILEGVVEEKKAIVNLVERDIEEKGEISEAVWGNFMESIPEPETIITEYERTPSLIVELGATYHLKMDLTEHPFEHECDGQFGPYMKTAFKVFFDKVSDEELYDMKYKYGDYEGEPAYTKGRKYTLWLDDKAKGLWAQFWKRLNSNGLPDNRMFTFKHTKKGIYNDFRFGLPKK